MDWGSFLQGFSGAYFRERDLAQQRQQRAEESKLKENMVKNQLRLEEMRQNRLDAEEARKQAGYEKGVGIADQLMAPQAVTPEPWSFQKDMAPPQQPPESRQLASVDTEPPSMQNQLIAAQLYKGGNIPAQAFGLGANARGLVTSPGQIIFGPDGKIIAENTNRTPERQAIGPEGRMFAIQEKIINGTATEAEKKLFVAWPDTIRTLSGNRAQGPFDVKADPVNQNTQREFSQAGATGTMRGGALEGAAQTALTALAGLDNSVNQIEQTFSPDFLGPVKGRDVTFNARRQVGSMAGAPVSEQETNFRQSLANVSDLLLRARSGAQINEQEYARLSALLPKATDEPQVFAAGLARFKRELAVIRAERIRLGTTPRAELGATGQTQQAAPTPVERVQMNGAWYIKRNGQWFPE